VQVSEARDEIETSSSDRPKGTTAPLPDPDAQPQAPPARFQIRADHFAHAIDEQRERYTTQEAAEEERGKQDRGRQRLIDMAADYDQQQKDKPALRGFRLWFARLFRLA
jgi:transitional endoplasmic reticulum ATPase